MKRIVISTLAALLISVMLNSANHSTLPVVADEIAGGASASTEQTDRNSSCGPASAQDEPDRRSAEEKLLNSTVRIYVETWRVKSDESGYDYDSKVAHATIKDGRFLVTHNHFSRPLGGEQEVDSHTVVRVRTLQGETVIDLPLTEISITIEDEQLLVLDLGEQGASVLRSAQDAQSAEFAICKAEEILPGTTVAQIDWDGETTRVDWTTVSEVQIVDGAARIVLADGVKPGASGGGVFLSGRHVANNWTLMQVTTESGQVLGEASSAALNTAQIATPSAGA
jgi:hypothetical protein